MSDPITDRWQKFEELGEEQVRKNLAARRYGDDNKPAAEAWLKWKSDHASAASQAEANDIARAAAAEASRAADAAERAVAAAERTARAAESANRRATIAITISIISIIVAIVISVSFRH